MTEPDPNPTDAAPAPAAAAAGPSHRVAAAAPDPTGEAAADFAPAGAEPAPAAVEPAPAAAESPPAAAEPAQPAATEAAQPAAPETPRAAAAAPSLEACAALLAQHFPALFGQPAPRPLKLRIQADIQQRAPGVFTRRVLGLFFSRHTTTGPYLKALIASPQRFDLDGQPAGEVTAEHREAAAAELQRRLAIRRERIEAQRQAQRGARAPAAPAAGGATRAEHAVPRGAPAQRPGRDTPGQGPDRPHRRDGRDGRDGRDERELRGAMRGAAGDRAARTDRSTRSGRPQPPGRPHLTPRDTTAQAPSPNTPPARPAPVAAGQTAPDPAQLERLRLVRAWEGTPLSRANFCALKGISEATLEEAIRLVRSGGRG